MFPATATAAYAVRVANKYLSHLLRHTEVDRCGKESLWTSAYFVGTAGAVSADIIRRYITECQGN